MVCNLFLNNLYNLFSSFFINVEQRRKYEWIDVPKKAGFFSIFELLISLQYEEEIPSFSIAEIEKGSSILNSFFKNYYYNIDPLDLCYNLDTYGLSDFSMFSLGLSLWFFYAAFIIVGPVFQFKKFIPLSSQYYQLNKNKNRLMHIKGGILFCLFIIQILLWQYKAGIFVLNSFIYLIVSQNKIFFISLPFVIFSLIITCSCLIIKIRWDLSKGYKISKLSVGFLGYSITVLIMVIIIFVLKSSGYNLNEFNLQFLFNLSFLIDFIFFGRQVFNYYDLELEYDNLIKIVNPNSDPTVFIENNGEGNDKRDGWPKILNNERENKDSRMDIANILNNEKENNGKENKDSRMDIANILNNENKNDGQTMNIDSNSPQVNNSERSININNSEKNNDMSGQKNEGHVTEDEKEIQRAARRDKLHSNILDGEIDITDQDAAIEECVKENEESNEKINNLTVVSRRLCYKMEVDGKEIDKLKEELKVMENREEDEEKRTNKKRKVREMEAEYEDDKRRLEDIKDAIKKEEIKKDENDEIVGKALSKKVKLEDQAAANKTEIVSSIKESLDNGQDPDLERWQDENIIKIKRNGKIIEVKNHNNGYLRGSQSDSENYNDSESDSESDNEKDKIKIRSIKNSLLNKPLGWGWGRDRGRGGSGGSSTAN